MAAEENGKVVGPHNPCIPKSRSEGLGLMKTSKIEKETQQGQKQRLV